MNRPFKNFKNNQGISLVIALIFLFISTLIGVTALRTSILNEKMTLNSLQRERALEAAEAALLAGEADVAMSSSNIINAVFDDINSQTRALTAGAQNCTALNGGVCAPHEFFNPDGFANWIDVPGNAESNNVWSDTDRHRELTDDITAENQLNTPPRYIIEFMGYVQNMGTEGDTLCVGPSEAWQLNSWPYCNLDPALFRITARATAGNNNQTTVMLQTTYVVN